jgi:Ca2+-binding EF-hand superfamily protein
MKQTLLILAMTALCGTFSLTQAQQPRPGGLAERRVGATRGANPVIAALDANKDGVIDENEIANASVALKKLDKNGDGKLTEDELRPAPPLTGAASAAEQTVTRLMQFDKNGDGKLSKDELPERMQAMMERGDADKDGFLTKDEIRKMTESKLTRPAPAVREGSENGERPAQLPAPAPAK